MKSDELTYWVTLALMEGISTVRKNQIYVGCYLHQPQYPIRDLFENPEVRNEVGVTALEELLFSQAHKKLTYYASLVENLLSHGHEILPITSEEYPKALKVNLKYSAPCVLFISGDKALLNQQATAIVGSRNASQVSLDFTANISRKAVTENKVVVSGFARGVDRCALDSALEFDGKSIIVLPQGITTFDYGFRLYYHPIRDGKVLVMSAFNPIAQWSVDFAMARNPLIYGLATEIYVAQSQNKGGTWSGVMDGLSRGRKIFVRIPTEGEVNANNLLIQKGAIGVDDFGNLVQ